MEKLKAEDNVKGLIKAVDYKKDTSVRQAAADALGQLGDAHAIKPLIAALRRDQDHNVRQAAAKALGMIGTPMVSPLQDALKGSVPARNWPVCEATVEALDYLGW